MKSVFTSEGLLLREMKVLPGLVKGARIKACTECRQQKLKCDAKDLPSLPCSRCHRQHLRCEISQSYRRVKRRRKSELRAEVESLRNQLQQASSTERPDESSPEINLSGEKENESNTMNLGPSTPTSITHANPEQILSCSHMQESQYANERDNPISSVANSMQSAWTIGDLSVGNEEVQDCFEAFTQSYLPYQPVVESTLRPADCYVSSPLLFWTIIAIGSRRYVKDPTLIISLAPKITEIIEKTILSTDGSLFTIQAFLLLCAWPLPFDSLSHDYSPTLAGSVLNIAITHGLHVHGVGQDFSRKRLLPDRHHQELRMKLWSICISTCQQISAMNGTPPIWIPDTYDHASTRNSYDSLPSSVRFQKKLNQLHTEALFNIETKALAQPSDERDKILAALIESLLLKCAPLEYQCPTLVDKFAYLAAKLQLLQFYLFLPRVQIDDLKKQTLFTVSCELAELAMSLDQTQQFCEYAPLFLVKYLHLAATLILRLERSPGREFLDTARGKRCYFGIINLHKRMSVRSDDFWARCSVSLPQMWSSRKAYRRSDGTVDTLLLRCRSRLGMSVVYDSYWWWRKEFAGVPHPYEDDKTIEDGNIPPIGDTPGTDSAASLFDVGWSPQFSFADFDVPFADNLLMDQWSATSS